MAPDPSYPHAEDMFFRIAGQAVMVLHFAVLLFLAVGGFLAWRWPKAWFAHLAMVCWGLLAIMYPVICPLTYLENEFRAKAGESGLKPGGFIDTYIEGVVYPEERTTQIRWLVVFVVAVSWAGALLLLRRRRGRAAASPEAAGAESASSNTASPESAPADAESSEEHVRGAP